MNGNFNAKQIAADRAHRDIPHGLQVIFEDTTDNDLDGVIANSVLPYPHGQFSAATRMHARAEANYREAFGIVVDLDPRGRVRRRVVDTPEKLEAAMQLAEAETKALPPPVDRSRWSTKILLDHKAAYDAAPERKCKECGATFKALHGPEFCTACWNKKNDIERGAQP